MIDKRLKEKIDPTMQITPRSTPVMWFGNYEKSRACTISLNPSDREFYYKPKDQENYTIPENLLTGAEERLCSRERLHKRDCEELDDNDINIVKDYCTNYFTRNNYFRDWFNPLDTFLREYGGYSYLDGSCVHLDIVQWATTPKWDDLNPEIRQKLRHNDIEVLKYLLDHKDFEIIFLNGRTVADTVSEFLGVSLNMKTLAYENNDKKERSINIYSGIYGKAKIIGWNKYFQYTFKNINNIRIFCELLRKNI